MTTSATPSRLPAPIVASILGQAALSAQVHSKGVPMTWTKPVFELVELCNEVTTYFYHR